MTGIKWLLAAVFVGWVLLSAVVALQDEPADSMGGISGDSVGAAIYGGSAGEKLHHLKC